MCDRWERRRNVKHENAGLVPGVERVLLDRSLKPEDVPEHRRTKAVWASCTMRAATVLKVASTAFETNF